MVKLNDVMMRVNRCSLLASRCELRLALGVLPPDSPGGTAMEGRGNDSVKC